MDLFGKGGMMTEIFSVKDHKWKAYKNSEKSKHAFMVNRLFSINFPVQAQQMNTNGFNPYITVETWRFIGKQFGRAPKWIWTKINKATTKKKGKKFVPAEETILYYIKSNEISLEQFNDAMKIDETLLLEYLHRIEKSMETSE